MLGEKKLAFDDVVEKYWEGRPQFLELNPSGLTPVLVEEEAGKRVVFCESRAIIDHLEETEPDPGLLPRETAFRASARKAVSRGSRPGSGSVSSRWSMMARLSQNTTRLPASSSTSTGVRPEGLSSRNWGRPSQYFSTTSSKASFFSPNTSRAWREAGSRGKWWRVRWALMGRRRGWRKRQ